jgi:predicted transcriptional regulator of viral defense system
MSTFIETYLYNWPKSYIRDQDIRTHILNRGPSPKRRSIKRYEEHSNQYDAVKYAIKKGYLVKIKRGLYAINLPHKKTNYDTYEMAQAIYSPSYISLESALSFHGWIPETVYIITASTTRRSKKFNTPIGYFNFIHTPSLYFYDEVTRIESGESIFFMAEPWKALADYIYAHKKTWDSIQALSSDLRIEIETLTQSNLLTLEKIANSYDSKKVQTILKKFLSELKK